MSKPRYYFLVCDSSCLFGRPQEMGKKQDVAGSHAHEGCPSWAGYPWPFVQGPELAAYPADWWFGQVSEGEIELILDCLEDEETVDESLMC